MKEVPRKFHGVATGIVGGLGKFIGSDRKNAHCFDQRFCVAMVAGNGYKVEVGVEIETTRVQSQIMVEYGNLPICCRFCWAFNHLLKDCLALDGKQKDGGKNLPANVRATSKASGRDFDTIVQVAQQVELSDTTSPLNEEVEPQLEKETSQLVLGQREEHSQDEPRQSLQGSQGNDRRPGDSTPYLDKAWQEVLNRKDKYSTKRDDGSSGSSTPSRPLAANHTGNVSRSLSICKSPFLIIPSHSGLRLPWLDIEMADVQ